MVVGAYAEVGARLCERGYAAIPIMPGTKRPGQRRGGEWIGMSNWREEYSRRAPSTFEIDHWSRSDAGVCVVTGPASKHLIGVDIDTDEPAIVDAIHAVLPPTTARKSGAKGETLFFRAPAIKESRSFNIAGKRVVDLIGPGRQTVLPPTIHPDTGAPYRWTGPDALEDLTPAELPEVGADLAERIAEALKPHGYEPEPERFIDREPVDADKPHRLLNETALGRLDVWVPQLGLYRCRKTPRGYEAVATWRPSSTWRPDEKRKLNLKIVPDGIRDFGADRGYTPIDVVMASQGCDLDTAFKFLAGAVGWSLDQVTLPATIKADPPDDVPPSRPDPLADLTHVPGVVGDIVDWITATARRPNRVLALGAALTIVGTLIGRRVAGPTRSGTHLYVVTLSPTGAGKQHAKDCLVRLMTAVHAQHHIGPDEFISMPAVVNYVLEKPLSVCPQDEFGAFLKRINSRRASGFEASISKALRSLWGCSFEAFITPQWAGRTSQIIRAPAVSLCGWSTPEDFYGGLQGADVTNGFLNRFLVLSSGARVPEKETTDAEPGVVPEGLKTALLQLYHWDGTQLGTARLNDPGLDPEPEMLPWASEAAQRAYVDFARHVEAEMDKRPDLEPFIARTPEIALRLATIRSAARWARGAMVSVEAVEWGRDVVHTATLAMAEEAMSHMAENERQSWHNRISRLIERRRVVTIREIQQYIRCALRSADLKDILSNLCEAGSIEPVFADPAAKISRVKGYRWLGI